MKRTLLLGALVFSTTDVRADALEAGHKVATTCIACHGEKGVSANDLWPNLAGQKKQYLIKQLTAFQAGERKDPLMTPMSGTLSKEDIENVSVYFASLKTSP